MSLAQCTPGRTRLVPTASVYADAATTRGVLGRPGVSSTSINAASAACAVCRDGKLHPTGSVRHQARGGRGRRTTRIRTARTATPPAKRAKGVTTGSPCRHRRAATTQAVTTRVSRSANPLAARAQAGAAPGALALRASAEAIGPDLATSKAR